MADGRRIAPEWIEHVLEKCSSLRNPIFVIQERASLSVSGARYRQAEVIAQGRAGIFLWEQAVAVEIRPAQPSDIDIRARHIRSSPHKPVACRRGEPFPHLIVHLQ